MEGNGKDQTGNKQATTTKKQRVKRQQKRSMKLRAGSLKRLKKMDISLATLTKKKRERIQIKSLMIEGMLQLLSEKCKE